MRKRDRNTFVSFFCTHTPVCAKPCVILCYIAKSVSERESIIIDIVKTEMEIYGVCLIGNTIE